MLSAIRPHIMDQIMHVGHLCEILYLLQYLIFATLAHNMDQIMHISHICYNVSYCYEISHKYVLMINIWMFVITTEHILIPRN